ncbi:CLUMA_CG015856, isoform A [Clunio marinus]|uniref:CLUMA_CG015856, isoform A n=1 Tax=Clunio marinus TaxID=568069 RepID=A0A1J1ISJ3_9DIPT|nr:CLUMA_CG015856, isoform A [Clunio marinus]
MSKRQTAIHWFRKGLRVHDNPALATAVNEAIKRDLILRPMFMLDPTIIQWLKVGPNRWRFLQQTLADLDKNLRKLNTKLFVVRGNPKEDFIKLFKEWNVILLTFESDIEPYSVDRDATVIKAAKQFHIEVIQECSHTIFNPELVVKRNGGSAPLTYQKFLSVASSIKVPSPVEFPPKLPASSLPVNDHYEEKDENCYDVPTLKELGLNEKDLGSCQFPGGESEALSRMEMNLKRKKWICDFEKPKTSPNSLEPSTTVLSPYLKFGALSSRLFYKRLKEVYKGSKHSNPPVSLEGQIMWREFYYTVAATTPNFNKMVGNRVCAQIPWVKNQKYLEAWSFGRTGYPFIDAIMRQLRQEGWIHHLARHAVACFLTRGDLWCHWEEGQKVFEELLLDADWALNAGNWMWLSASAFFHQYFRVYSPVAFGKKTDSEGKFIKKYVPELKNFPSGIIYEPWKASLENQNKYGCIIGKDYPNRIVDHDIVMKENLVKMKAAYAKKKKFKR